MNIHLLSSPGSINALCRLTSRPITHLLRAWSEKNRQSV